MKTFTATEAIFLPNAPTDRLTPKSRQKQTQPTPHHRRHQASSAFLAITVATIRTLTFFLITRTAHSYRLAIILGVNHSRGMKSNACKTEYFNIYIILDW
jgi:hypothetical protein